MHKPTWIYSISTEVIPALRNIPILNFLRHSNYIYLMRLILTSYYLSFMGACLNQETKRYNPK